MTTPEHADQVSIALTVKLAIETLMQVTPEEIGRVIDALEHEQAMLEGTRQLVTLDMVQRRYQMITARDFRIALEGLQ